MAEILGKDLDNLDISEAARMPYDMTEGKNEPSGPQFITGTDLERSARISQDWKKPVATIAQVTGQGKITGESDYGVVTQVVNSLGNAAFDAIANLPDNTKNILAQVTLQGTSITPELIEKSRQEILHGKMTDFLPKEKAQAREEMVDVLDRRDYPVAKYAQRVIANATENTNNRALVRELYANARGIDLSKWYNEGAQIVGNMVPLMGLGGVAGATGKSLGLSRAATTRLATNIMKGATAIQMGGDYAYETAADYLARTGDTNFENFTAKDAKGFSALAYGAIGAEIEFMGGVEPIVAGSLSKVGLKSGLGRAGLKIAAGEASEEFLQGLTEQLTRVMDGSVNKTWGEALKESLQGAAWGAFIGGTIGTTAFYTNRANLTKNLRKMFPQMKEKEATKLAEKMIETTADVSSQDQTLRDSLRKKVEFMYDGVDIENRENTIDAITDLEYAIINMDSAERGIELADNPIFKGEVNELGWFRDGIPENRRAEIQGYVNEIRDLKAQLKELNSAETKDFVKIDTVEEKLRLAQETALDKVSDLVRKDKDEIRQMLAEQKNNFALRRAIQNIQERARRAISATEKAEKTTQESAQKAQLKAKTRQEQEVRGAIRGLRDKIGGASPSQETPETAIAQDVGYQLLKDNGYSDAQIAKMKPRELIQAVQTLARRQLGAEIMFQEQLDLANENARLDDIYPEYKGETINIDGKERTVYNSNGDRIAKSEPALRNFYKWFGDSKVVDEQGKPLVVYHGTDAEFDTFGNYGANPQARIGAYFFTDDYMNADGYAGGEIVMGVYLSLQNPLIIDAKSQHWNDIDSKYGNTTRDIALNEKVRKQYDGVIFKDVADNFAETDDIGNVYVAFESTQIKSVNNRGTFSEDTGNIYFQKVLPNRGYVDYSYSVRSAQARENNILPKTLASKKLGIPASKIPDLYGTDRGEWHHTGLYANRTPHYDVGGYVALKNGNIQDFVDWSLEYGTKITTQEKQFILDTFKGKISQETIDLLPKVFDFINQEIDIYDYDLTQEILPKNPRKQHKTFTKDDVQKDVDWANTNIEKIVENAKQGVETQNLFDDTGDYQISLSGVSDKRSIMGRIIETVRKKYDLESGDLSLGLSYESDIKLNPYFLQDVIDARAKADETKNQTQPPARTIQPEEIGYTDAVKFDELGNILFQGRATGTGDKKRGAYVPEYRFIYKANSMDESTLSHELAHDWFEVFYERYRSGAASKEFMTSWGALEKALGITDESTKAERAKASENFARAYEGWVLNKKDWEKNLNVDDTNRDKIIKEFEKYQGNLRDVYESVMNPYFKNTWGNVGELKPELVNWFERMTNITSLDTLVKRGEMTETEARGEVFNRALDKAIEDSNDPETKRVYENVKTLNDTSRYEVEGGNKNAIQARLSELARAIDENNMAVKKDYNTHRDMMKVAQDADTFVKTRTDEALKIINAEIPEVEGLFKEDLYTALERLAIEESNLDLLDELRSSAVANGLAKELGQRVAGFRNFMSDGQFDVMSPLKSLDRRFEKATENRKAKKSIEQAADLYAESVREQDATASKNLESFLNELECK